MRDSGLVSVIIPTYNEGKTIKSLLSCFNYNSDIEVLVVDGASTDKTLIHAKAFPITLISSNKGRALQMNEGAKRAKGDILVFLHADCILEQSSLEAVRKCIKKGYAGGCFSQRINRDVFIYRFIESFGNARAMLTKVFYGDQGIFVRKDMFFKIGGFEQVPIMEDVLFTKRMRRMGKTKVLSNKILVSSRRWVTKGIFNTIFLYSWLNILFWLGVPLSKVKAFYNDAR